MRRSGVSFSLILLAYRAASSANASALTSGAQPHAGDEDALHDHGAWQWAEARSPGAQAAASAPASLLFTCVCSFLYTLTLARLTNLVGATDETIEEAVDRALASSPSEVGLMARALSIHRRGERHLFPAMDRSMSSFGTAMGGTGGASSCATVRATAGDDAA